MQRCGGLARYPLLRGVAGSGSLPTAMLVGPRFTNSLIGSHLHFIPRLSFATRGRPRKSVATPKEPKEVRVRRSAHMFLNLKI
jgi:hypothetical protein